MENLADKNLKFGQNFLIQCILVSFSLFQALVCKCWLSRFGEKIQFIAIIDTPPVNQPIIYGNFEGNKTSRLANIF